MSTARIIADYPSSIDTSSFDAINADSIRSSLRNIVINGDMLIAQRGATKTIDQTHSTFSGYTTVDRWKSETNATDQVILTFSQDNDSPAEFEKSLKVLVATPETTLDNDEYLRITHTIEQRDLLRLNYGTASPKSVTLSFWVKSGTVGVYSISLTGNDSAQRNIGSTYTVLVANTWEKKTVTFSGDAGGVMALSSAKGMKLHWTLSAGSNYTSQSNSSWGAYNDNSMSTGQVANLMSTALNYWNITGVQLEVGVNVTEFEHKAHSLELLMCQRYYQTINKRTVVVGVLGAIGFFNFNLPLCTPLNANSPPTVDIRVDSNMTLGDHQNTTTISADPTVSFYEENATSVFMQIGGATGLASTLIGVLSWDGFDMAFEAEL